MRACVRARARVRARVTPGRASRGPCIYNIWSLYIYIYIYIYIYNLVVPVEAHAHDVDDDDGEDAALEVGVVHRHPRPPPRPLPRRAGPRRQRPPEPGGGEEGPAGPGRSAAALGPVEARLNWSNCSNWSIGTGQIGQIGTGQTGRKIAARDIRRPGLAFTPPPRAPRARTGARKRVRENAHTPVRAN